MAGRLADKTANLLVVKPVSLALGVAKWGINLAAPMARGLTKVGVAGGVAALETGKNVALSGIVMSSQSTFLLFRRVFSSNCVIHFICRMAPQKDLTIIINRTRGTD